MSHHFGEIFFTYNYKLKCKKHAATLLFTHNITIYLGAPLRLLIDIYQVVDTQLNKYTPTLRIVGV